jgi:IS605 OrfB family transposase
MSALSCSAATGTPGLAALCWGRPDVWSHPPGTICPVPFRLFLPAGVAQVSSGASATTRLRAECEEPPSLSQLRDGPVVSVDLNEGHIEVARLDRSGNPVGQPVTVPLELKGLSTKARDARTREAITEVIIIAKDHGTGAIVAEQLGFEQDKTRERFGRRKAFRAIISGFPTIAFRDRLAPMAARAGLAVIGVDPRYTSKVGGRAWCWVLLGGPTAKVAKTSNDSEGTAGKARAPAGRTGLATVHHGAAVAIGRSAYAYGLGAETPLRAKARERQAQSASKPRSAPHRSGGPRGTSPRDHQKDGSSDSCAPKSAAAQVRSPGLRAQRRDLPSARPKAARSIAPVPSAPVLAPPKATADGGRRCGYGEGHPVAGRTQKTRDAAGQPPGWPKRLPAEG